MLSIKTHTHKVCRVINLDSHVLTRPSEGLQKSRRSFDDSFAEGKVHIYLVSVRNDVAAGLVGMCHRGKLNVGDFTLGHGRPSWFTLHTVWRKNVWSDDVGVIEIEDCIHFVKEQMRDFLWNKRKTRSDHVICKRNVKGVFVKIEDLVDFLQHGLVVSFVFGFEKDKEHVVGVVFVEGLPPRWSYSDRTRSQNFGIA